MPQIHSNKYRKHRNQSLPLQGLFFILLLFFGTYAFMSSSFFSLEEVTISGNKQVKSEEVINLADITMGINIFKINKSEIEQKLLLHPIIKNVNIKRDLPGGLRIKIIEREGLGVIPQDGNFIVVDKEAVFLYRENSLTKANLPIITGVRPGKVNVGENIMSENLAEGLHYLSIVPPEISTVISEINCTDPENIVMYTLDGIEIRLGNIDKASEKIRSYMEVVSQEYEEKIQYIDLSYENKPVVKFISVE